MVRLADLGAGGMAEVLEVLHPKWEGSRAIKVLRWEHREDWLLAMRLRREAQLLARVRHPNVVRCFGAGQLADGRPFVVLERLLGRTLRAAVSDPRRPTLVQAVRWVGALLGALDAVHRAGIIHCDVKPDNVILCDDEPRLKLVDFGAAQHHPNASPWAAARRRPYAVIRPREPATCACWSSTVHESTSSTDRTRSVTIGTPRYMAPEQWLSGPADPRTDVYGAGLLLFELLAGARPFGDTCGDQLMAAHCERGLAPSLRAAALPPALEPVIRRATARSPAARFGSARAMMDELRAAASVAAHLA